MKPSTLFHTASFLLVWGVTPLYAQLTPSVAGVQKNISGKHYAGVIGEMTLIQTQTSPVLTITQGYLQPHETKSQPNALGELSFADHTIHIYPNPTQGELNVQIANVKEAEGKIFLYNALGQIVAEQSISFSEGKADIQLDLKNIAIGIYTLSFQSGNVQKNLKVMKE